MRFNEEFSTVNLLKDSSAKTKGVDAFALSIIKAERQIRKLTTHLVFQFPCFTKSEIQSLKDTLANNRHVYFEGMVKGFNSIYTSTIEDMIGPQYKTLWSNISEAMTHRNKIFHGQLTNKNLTSSDLFSYVDGISEWCELLAMRAEDEIGYDGFDRNSFQKSKNKKLVDQLNVTFDSIDDYEKFIRTNMQRKN